MQLKKEKVSLFIESPSGDMYTNPLLLLSCFFSTKEKNKCETKFVPEKIASEENSDVKKEDVWISSDPARQFHDLYSYGNNPVNSIDPNGRRTLFLGGAVDLKNTASYSVPLVHKITLI